MRHSRVLEETYAILPTVVRMIEIGFKSNRGSGFKKRTRVSYPG